MNERKEKRKPIGVLPVTRPCHEKAPDMAQTADKH